MFNFLTAAKRISIVAFMLSLGSYSPAVTAALSCSEVLSGESGLIEGYIRQSTANPAALQYQFGPLFYINDLRVDPNTKKITAERNEIRYRQLKKVHQEKLATLPVEISPEVKSMVVHALHPTVQPDGSVLLSVSTQDWLTSLGSTKSDQLFETGMRNRFALLYQQTVAWVYQLSGLEEFSPVTSAKMTDELSDYIGDRKDLTFHLMFDQTSWRIQLRILQQIWNHNVEPNTTGSAKNFSFTDLVSYHPVFPLAGLITSGHRQNSQYVVELKRYFKNDDEDPFELTEISKKDDFLLRHRLILSAVENLEANSILQIHSHTRVHTATYRKLGFSVTQEITNPKFPAEKIDLLESTREKVIEKIRAIIAAKEGK